jgi:hypothetical protein
VAALDVVRDAGHRREQSPAFRLQRGVERSCLREHECFAVKIGEQSIHTKTRSGVALDALCEDNQWVSFP